MNEIKNKLTEDETVLLLIDYLEANGYVIEDYCLGHKRGIDIVSSKNNKKFLLFLIMKLKILKKFKYFNHYIKCNYAHEYYYK